MRMQSKEATGVSDEQRVERQGRGRRSQPRKGQSLLQGCIIFTIAKSWSLSLLELCVLNDCEPHELGRFIRNRGKENIAHIRMHCEPLFTDYSSSAINSAIVVEGWTMLGANQQRAFGEHRSGCTVEQYLFARYKRTLIFSHLPCLRVIRGIRKLLKRQTTNAMGEYHYDYFPIECLRFMTTTTMTEKAKGTDDNDDDDEDKEDGEERKSPPQRSTTADNLVVVVDEEEELRKGWFNDNEQELANEFEQKINLQ